MELTQHGLLEELLAPRRDTWTSTGSVNEFLIPNGWSSFECFDESPLMLAASNPPFLGLTSPTEPSFQCPLFNEVYSFLDGFTVPDKNIIDIPSNIPIQEEYSYISMVEDGELGLLIDSLEQTKDSSKVLLEMEPAAPVFNMDLCGEMKKISRVKKVEGQPSKNLMAERRRRKRLNDRLSMLRSIVPKISKMDRTSILGDTIDYMKELLEKINKIQDQEDVEADFDQVNLKGNFKDLKPNELLVRNSPKFNVERRNIGTRIEICCAAKPGLLSSTVHTLEALGLDIQQCVISCFNDFSMQASCSEAAEQRTMISSEDIKQALFRNAGYGGRCL
uniref:Putative transcription factor bHLH93-like n=1 Tax=Davidia involucrata TaxID=16924 RepID=A0A5B7AFV1_DAVIN